ncbi:MAG: ribonuclease P [Candidatus Heimdallarchaeota archaeon]|nr:ribonuclease P [Candidatus Heimdallarchaeota archaeon]
MARKRYREKVKTKDIAFQRIHILLSKADEIYPQDHQLAQRYGELARKIAMKVRIRLPEKWSKRYCRHCKRFLYPGINAHIRVKPGKPSRVILYCHYCDQGSTIRVY